MVSNIRILSIIFVSIVFIGAQVVVQADQFVMSLSGTMTFCWKQEIINPNVNAKEGSDVRLAYICKSSYAVDFIAINIESTPFGGCYVNLNNIRSLCYTSQLTNQGDGLTVKAGNCFDYPGQQLWNFVKAGDSSYKIHPKGRSDLCLTSVLTWDNSNRTAPLSLQPCFKGKVDAVNARRDTWNSECTGNRFKDFRCSEIDPTANCGITE